MSAGAELPFRKVRVLLNPKAGVWWSYESMLDTMEKAWGREVDLTYQFSHSAADGQAKTRRAVRDGVDLVLIVGGDGMVNSIGAALLGTETALGVIPAGSGNGFARHFGTPLEPDKAVRALTRATRQRIDVGEANGHVFFVTCSMAWDGALVRTFQKSPVRGVLPYVFAAVYEYVEYAPQAFSVQLDKGARLHVPDPMVFTVANLTQFGGGARIAPRACADDGFLELVVIRKKDFPLLVTRLNRLFDGTLHRLQGVLTRRFKNLRVQRERSAPIQVDGELVETGAVVEVTVKSRALSVLVPHGAGT